MPARRKKTRRTHKSRSHSAIVVYKFIIYLFLVAVLGTFFFKLATPLISNTANVLGISSFFAKGGDGDNSGSGSSGSDSSGNSGSGSGNNEVRFEVRTNEGDRLRARTQNDRTKVEIRTGGVRTRLESRPDRTIIKQEIEIEDEVEVATDGGGFEEPKRHLGARTHFPITIDLATNALIITTPAGTKTVTILPDVAVQNMITKGIISKIGGHVIASPSGEIGDATGSGEIGTSIQEDTKETSENIELTEEEGLLVYKIKGSLKQKFLGVIPLDLEREVTVSAESGEVTSVQESLFTRFLNALSF